jgi:transcriptional regulator with XRE-family HTH domain
VSETLPERIRRLRKERGLALKQVAAVLDTSTGQASNMETGKRRVYAGHILPLARLFGVSAEQLLGSGV